MLLLFLSTVAELYRCLALVTTGVTGAEELLFGCFTCSLSNSMVLAPVLQLTPPVYPVQLELLPLCLGIARPIYTGDRVPLYPMPTG